MATSIFSFVPAFGQTITAATFLSTHQLQATLATKGIGGGISTMSFPDIAELRSMATTIWYDAMPQYSHLLFIDADMGFPPDLVLDMLLFNEPVVGCVYPQRRLPVSWAGSGTGQPTANRRGDFMEMEGVGMGVCLIRRDCIATMLEKMPEIVDTRLDLHPAVTMIRNAGANRLIRAFEKLDIPERGVVSEDLSFCIRWRKCGGTVWAAMGHKISHVGPYDYSGRYLDWVNEKFAEQEAAKAAQAAQVPVANLTGTVPDTMPAIIPPMPEVTVPMPEPAGDSLGPATEMPVAQPVEATPVKRKRGRPKKKDGNGARVAA